MIERERKPGFSPLNSSVSFSSQSSAPIPLGFNFTLGGAAWELVDKYQPQMIYFDNGVNPRAYDPVKLRAAAYLYNRAAASGKEATMATKDVAYLFGSVQDFEKMQRAPKWIYPAAGWQCDDSIGSTWGYTTGMNIRSAESVIHELVELCSMGGNLLLNISPMGDGSIPDNQGRTLLAVGDWLRVNGEAIYGSRPWIRPQGGGYLPARCRVNRFVRQS